MRPGLPREHDRVQEISMPESQPSSYGDMYTSATADATDDAWTVTVEAMDRARAGRNDGRVLP